MRSLLLSLSRRRSLGRLATRTPVTRTMVRRFVSGETLDEALPALERIHAAGFARPSMCSASRSPRRGGAAAARPLPGAARCDRRAGPRPRTCRLKLTPDGPGHRPRPVPGEPRPGAPAGGRAQRLRAHRHGGPRQDRRDARPLARGATARPGRRASSSRRPSGGAPPTSRRSSPSAARVRLCKGAYNEPAAVAYPDKAEVDAAYRDAHGAAPARRRATRRSPPTTSDSSDAASPSPSARGSGRERFEFQMLYGVRRDLQEQPASRTAGRCASTCPFGREWYPYFMRRLAERPANVAFILRSVLREGRGRGSTKPGA